MHRACPLFYLLALWVMVPAPGLAYPIPAKPLWPLTAEATLIVVAEVTSVEPLARDEDSLNSAVAHLRVLETLKGPRRETVEVPFPRNLICPAPPRYFDRETVVAFLSRDKNAWQTVSLSYGTLYLKGGDLDDLRTMVRAAVAIQKTYEKSEALSHHKLEWLVQAAALPGTRWHGLLELDARSRGMRMPNEPADPLAELSLAQHQLTLLAGAFVDTPRFDHTMAMMLRQLHGYDDPRIDRAALGVLEGMVASQEPPRWTWTLMQAVLARWGDEKPESRLEETGASAWEVTPGQLRRIWSEAKGQLGIPDVPPTQIDDSAKGP